MKVTRAAQPFIPLCRRLLPLLPLPSIVPVKVPGVSLALLKATVLEFAILTGHLILYPSGIAQERLASPVKPRESARPPHAPATPYPPPAPSNPPGTPAAAATDATGATAEMPGAEGALGAPDATGEAPSAPRLPLPDRPPVVLLHGFIDNRSVFVLLRRSLAQHGARQLVSLNYSPLTCDIRIAAELLGRHVEELCDRTGSGRVDIVGHSLGGLIARYYVQRLGGDARVRTLVTLGTPHAGTKVAPLADAHPIVRQMRPGSPVIEELAGPAPGCRTRFVSFWSDLDRLMDPLRTACLDHPDLITRNIRVSGIGHLALPVHPAVANGVRQALDTPMEDTGTGDSTGGLTVA
ncbi:lipase [Streptomyces cyaneogriseus subsp. noncyanogenus]|uniref:Lipase n=1 Tax=Streptomyces cyaneogriseus subsp. noncyanogenus TaxID=477245 RepID=A0A0C5G494_9ACTN|nr:alpha/beta fold hydrolase [Streptomyces cyaneogriseus]AJP03415.1 lipase [Streptomyces cyaneogriseus subsp. noncyanogenus]